MTNSEGIGPVDLSMPPIDIQALIDSDVDGLLDAPEKPLKTEHRQKRSL